MKKMLKSLTVFAAVLCAMITSVLFGACGGGNENHAPAAGDTYSFESCDSDNAEVQQGLAKAEFKFYADNIVMVNGLPGGYSINGTYSVDDDKLVFNLQGGENVFTIDGENIEGNLMMSETMSVKVTFKLTATGGDTTPPTTTDPEKPNPEEPEPETPATDHTPVAGDVYTLVTDDYSLVYEADLTDEEKQMIKTQMESNLKAMQGSTITFSEDNQFEVRMVASGQVQTQSYKYTKDGNKIVFDNGYGEDVHLLIEGNTIKQPTYSNDEYTAYAIYALNK